MQRRSGMKHWDHKPFADLLHLPMDLGDLRVRDELAHRMTPERHNDTRIDDFNLIVEIIAGTRFDLDRLWIAIPRWTALYDIGDKYIGACHACLGKQLIQKFARCADKRASLLIFIRTGTLADEHDLGMGGSFSRHRMSPPLIEFTFCADGNLCRNRFQSLLSLHIHLTPYSL